MHEMESLISRLEQMAAYRPDKVFVRFLGEDNAELTYARLLADSRAFATYFRANGLTRGDVVLFMLRSGAGNYSAFIGAMMAGILPSFMPLPGPKQPPEIYWPIHAEIMGRKAVRAVLSDHDQALEIRKYLPDLDLLILTVENVQNVAAVISPDWDMLIHPQEPAFIQHSSGTTGVKKGVRLSHKAVLAQIDAYAHLLQFDESACVASWLPLYHDMGLITSFLMPMAKGASVVAISPFDWLIDPASWLGAASMHGCTFAWMPNFAFAHLARVVQINPAWDLSRMHWINCSEQCKATSFEQFREKFACVGVRHEAFGISYAMAENVFAVTQTQADGPPRALGRRPGAVSDPEAWLAESATLGEIDVLSCGRALPGVEIQIWDETGHPLPEGQVGEIVIRGPYLFHEYHDAPEATAQRIRDGWFRPHDLGLMDAGELFVMGRVDDLINLYGRKVYAHQVEFAVTSLPGVLPGRCVAIGHVSNDTGSQELVVLAETEAGVDLPRLRRAIKTKVDAEVGVTVARVELFGKGWLIKTTSGKISRYLNHQKYMDMLGRC